VTTCAAPPLFMQAWVAFLTAHTRMVSAVSRDLEAACGISLVWFDVLFQLSVAPDCRRRMHELARALLLSKSGLTRLVDRLEEAGLVARAAVPGDRRSLYVELTPAGCRLQDKARPLVQRSVGEHFGKQLGEAELATLRDALNRVAHSSGAA
jgi:DNA-binding MarR family transcriptional regulator